MVMNITTSQLQIRIQHGVLVLVQINVPESWLGGDTVLVLVGDKNLEIRNRSEDILQSMI